MTSYNVMFFVFLLTMETKLLLRRKISTLGLYMREKERSRSPFTYGN